MMMCLQMGTWMSLGRRRVSLERLSPEKLYTLLLIWNRSEAGDEYRNIRFMGLNDLDHWVVFGSIRLIVIYT